MEGFVTGLVESWCCECWKEGCGCDQGFGVIADALQAVTPCVEYFADCIWLLGSPLAFPLIFLFDPGPETDPPGGGWTISMLRAPIVRPVTCCFTTICTPCGQWIVRRQALGGNMSRYKLWQGYHDGPHCCARYFPGTPIVVRSGTYGEDQCPNTFLCLEVWCLAGIWSPCCAFDVSRRLMKEERGLDSDPTENRQNQCIGFFSGLSNKCFQLALCMWCASCWVGCCAPDSDGAQECSGEAGRASRACCHIVHTCWRGIWSVKLIGIGCMSAQMLRECEEEGKPLKAPDSQKMERDDHDDEGKDLQEDYTGPSAPLEPEKIDAHKDYPKPSAPAETEKIGQYSIFASTLRADQKSVMKDSK